jgi:L-aminopeptidase/D-esterase-like protein
MDVLLHFASLDSVSSIIVLAIRMRNPLSAASSPRRNLLARQISSIATFAGVTTPIVPDCYW